MARNRKKIAFYEVISKTRLKPDSGGAVGRLHPEKADKDESIAVEATTPVPEKLTRWPRRPKAVQFNASRIEISMPYQVAILLVLGVILLVLVVFRLGQISQRAANPAEEMAASQQKAAGQATAGTPKIPDVAEKITPTPASAEKVEPAKPQGNNVIVLVEYQAQADLVPVQRHFAEYGIETEIIRENGRYFLVTEDRYENTDTPGTEGYKTKQRIIQVGPLYKGKAPEGYETFSPHFFRDAYGKKLK